MNFWCGDISIGNLVGQMSVLVSIVCNLTSIPTENQVVDQHGDRDC